MNVLLIGAPGSGKGTQGERLARRLGLEHIAAGDRLRAEMAAGTSLGREVAPYVEGPGHEPVEALTNPDRCVPTSPQNPASAAN